ncbi:MAG: hypothetical protein JKY54_11080 [Flavobacteriales bacterium]|nr:hypothetical protein [Flavobacteriales bacterium]
MVQIGTISYNKNTIELSKNVKRIAETTRQNGTITGVNQHSNRPISIAENSDSNGIILPDTNVLFHLEKLINRHKENGEVLLALDATDELVKIKKDLLKIELDLVATNLELKMEEEIEIIQTQFELRLVAKDKTVLENERQLTQTIIISATLFSLIILFLSIVVFRKQKRVQKINVNIHNTEKEMLQINNALAEEKIKNQETRKVSLKKELDYKKKELTTFAIRLTERELLVERLKLIFIKIAPNSVPQSGSLTEIKILLQHVSASNESDLFARMENANSSFRFKLKTQFDNLNQSDIRLATLIVMKLSTKEVASIMGIESKSVHMKSYRLKRKLQLSSDINLSKYLVQFQ